MAYTSGTGRTEKPDRQVTEDALRIARRLRRDVPRALQAAANSFQKTAESHERTAKSFEQVAAVSKHRDECLEHAGRHRHFAREDRLLAEQLREWAANAAVRPLPNGLAYA